MANDLILCDSVQAIVDGFPNNKRKIQDYILETGHLFFNNPISSALNGANGIFQTFTLMQAKNQYTKVVKYVSSIDKTRTEALVRIKELDV